MDDQLYRELILILQRLNSMQENVDF